MTDNELIHQCLRNDRRCQQMLFERFAGKMMTVCLRFASNTAQAEDILQESFVKVFRQLHQFQHQGSFEGWIRRIVVNTALRLMQQEKKLQHQYQPDIIPDAGDSTDMLDLLETKELLLLIQQLPVGYRTVLNLFVFEGMTHEEIASQLGISCGTSRSQLAKARKYLQHLMSYHHKNLFV